MKIIFFEVNGGTFILRKITYNSATESFDVKTEAIETGKQTIFKCVKGLQLYCLVECLFKNLHKQK